MSNSEIICLLCGTIAAKAPRPLELIKSDPLRNGKVLSVLRFWPWVCEEGHSISTQDGPLWTEQKGHHSTHWALEFKGRAELTLGTAAHKRIGQLSDSDRRTFNDMMRGKRRPDWEWLESLAAKFKS